MLGDTFNSFPLDRDVAALACCSPQWHCHHSLPHAFSHANAPLICTYIPQTKLFCVCVVPVCVCVSLCLCCLSKYSCSVSFITCRTRGLTCLYVFLFYFLLCKRARLQNNDLWRCCPELHAAIYICFLNNGLLGRRLP